MIDIIRNSTGIVDPLALDITTGVVFAITVFTFMFAVLSLITHIFGGRR